MYLEILRIDGAQLTDKALEYIDYCRKLKSIVIEFCTNMTGSNFHIFQVDLFLYSIQILIYFK
jgi:hypothetical protein